MSDKLRENLRALLMVILPVIVVVSLNYMLYSFKGLSSEYFTRTSILLAIMTGINSLFYVLHKYNFSLINHVLVVGLGIGLSFVKTANLEALDMKFTSMIALYLIHLGIMDGVTFLIAKKIDLIRLRNIVFVIGGIIGYSLSMTISLFMQGMGFNPEIISKVVYEAFNLYIFIGLSFGVGMLVYDQTEKR